MFMPSVDLAAEVDAAQMVINAASAVQAIRVAQYAGRDEEQDASGAWVEVDHGLGHVSEFAADCFGPMLAMGPVAAGRKVDVAAALSSRLPVTLAAMSAGDLDSWRATIIATELSDASRESSAAVEALIYPAVLDESPGAVTKRVRRILARVDADAVRLKAAKERLDRFVHAHPSRVPGLTTWVASLPAADSAACWAAIDDLAHRMHGDDPTRTLEQCRADALVDLMLTNVAVTTTVTLMIPVQTVTVDEPTAVSNATCSFLADAISPAPRWLT
ncbi:MAG: 13E12 repeat family protein [Actinomycetota bacterium]|nr:13E12 repeat family protein [Actinomycetota bacterium]